MSAEIIDASRALRAEFDLGNEDENNWKRRNDLCRRLSAACDKQQSTRPQDLVDPVKPVFQPLLATCTTERTTLGISALTCLSSIFKLLGPQMAFQVDHMVPTLISLCGVTKKLTSKSAGACMDVVVVSIGYNSRLIAYICDAFKDKAASTRLFATGWLTTILKLYGKQLDAARDFPKIARALLDGLQDSQNTVREATRPTYWLYARLQGNDAPAIMDKLAKDKATALKNHKDNPEKPTDAKPARPGSALSQIRARSKANLKQSTTTKPATETIVTSNEAAKSTELSSSITGVPARKPISVTSMSAAPARMTGMARAATAPHGVSKRDFTHSTQSTEYAPGPIEGVSAPDGVFVALPSSPKAYNDGFATAEDRASYERAVAAKKKVRYGPEYGDLPEFSTSEKARHDLAALKHLAKQNPEKAAAVERKIKEEAIDAKLNDQDSLRKLQYAAVRRPRVVATPINPAVRHQKKPSTSRSKTTTSTTQTSHKSERVAEKEHLSHDQTMSDPVSRPESVAEIEHVDKTQPIIEPTPPVEVADEAQPETQPSIPDPATVAEEVADDEQLDTQPPVVGPVIRTEQAAEPAQVGRTTTKTSPSTTHVIDGKENDFVYSDGCTHKKAYEACKSKVTDARSELQRLKNALKTGRIDALGYKKLSGLLKDKPGQLLTNENDFNDLYITLVDALAANAAINAPPGNAARNRGHPFYNRHALIDSITRLLQQFPNAGEPQPGMALTAVVMCAATHPAGERFRTASTIEDAALTLVRLTADDSVLMAINNVADGLLLAHHQGKTDAQSFALGLRSLAALFARAAASEQQLFDVQERPLINVATTAIAAFRGECGREILGYVAGLKVLIPEDRLVDMFDQEDDRNLIMYYLGR